MSSTTIDKRGSDLPAADDILALLLKAIPTANNSALQFYAAKFSGPFVQHYVAATRGLAQQCPNCSVGLLVTTIAVHARYELELTLKASLQGLSGHSMAWMYPP